MNYNQQHFVFIFLFILIFSNIGLTQEVDPLDGVKIQPEMAEGISEPPGTSYFTPFENIRVNQDNTFEKQAEVSISVNSNNPDNLVSTWIDYRQRGTAKIAFGFSFDGGKTWNDGILPQNLGGFPYQGDPIVASDKDGNFFISFISFNTNPYTGGIFVAKSIDGGITWPLGNIRRLDSDDTIEDKPFIIIDQTDNTTANNIYVVWDYGYTPGPPPNYSYDIVFARSTDQGETFERSYNISDERRPNQLGSMLAVDTNGELYAVWYAGNQTGYRDFYFDMSIDGGRSFGADIVIITVDSYTPNLGINLVPRIYPFPNIVTNPILSGHLYLTWGNRVDAASPTAPDSSDVLFIRSTDYGITWSSPINVFNNGLNPSVTPNDQFMPWISINPSGDKIDIMY